MKKTVDLSFHKKYGVDGKSVSMVLEQKPPSPDVIRKAYLATQTGRMPQMRHVPEYAPMTGKKFLVTPFILGGIL